MIVIGTRGSDLALTQSRGVAQLLAEQGVATRLELIRTQGDREQALSLDKLQGKGFFTKEIEDALLDLRVDLAVHSLKDLPTESPPGLLVAATTTRADPRDCLLIKKAAYDAHAPELPLKNAARVGTSAVRRRAMLKYLRPDAEPVDLRGNVPTRVERLRQGTYDAVILAQAGLTRLGLDLSDLHVHIMPPEQFVPAPGQGALALQVRAADARVRSAAATLHDARAAECIAAERLLLSRMEGGCHAPLGAYAQYEPAGMSLIAFWHGPTSTRARQITVRAAAAAALADAAFAQLQAP